MAKTFASKASIAFVAAAMLFSMIAPAAQAQSSEDMQKMINDLMAQIAALQGQVGGSSSAAATGYTWTRDLKTGSTGADVKALQVFLNSDADTRVAATGAGSAGMETETYGPATAAAVSKFQVKYRADILAPANLVNPTGTFGPATRAKANALNAKTSPVDNGGDDEDTTDEEDEDTNDGELSGEASLDTFELEDGESTVEEGETDVTIGEITVEFADGDASISRMDVMLTGSNQPWDAFETISLWVDGEMVAEVDASDEDDYLDEDTGELRFSGLDIVAMEDESLDIAIGASIQNNLDNTELVDWTAKVTSVRYFDADGVATTDDSTDGVNSDTSSFEIQTAGTDEEIDLSLSTSNPDATDIVVDTDTDTNDVTVLVADIEATDSDIELNQVVVKVAVANGYSTTTVGTVLDEVRLVVDGQSFKAESVGTETDNAVGNGTGNGLTEGYSEYAVGTSTSATSVWYLFDIDGDVVVDEDGEVAMEVVVDLNDTDDATRYPNGTTITASVTSVERGVWEAEGAEDLGTSQFSGTAVGDTHTLVAEGIVIPVDSVEVSAATTGDNDQTGEFTIEFEVTAIEGDFYITDNVFASTSATNGVAYMVEVGSGTTTDSGVLSSTADEETDGVFTVREGETETFTLTVTVDTSASTQARVTLSEVNYSTNEDGVSATMAVYSPTPASDYRTAYKNINAN